MRIFKTKAFARFAARANLGDVLLCEAVQRAVTGLVDARLGGGVIKQRIARKGKGRSGGFRSVILFREKDKAFFVYGFAKGRRSNISQTELKAFRMLANGMLNMDDAALLAALRNGTIMEVICDDKTI